MEKTFYNRLKYFCLFFFLITIQFLPQSKYVILISLDGARWDYINRGVTPTLDSIIKNGVKALSLQPSFPSKTFPNHYSIITGMYPQNHGIISNTIFNPNSKKTYRLGDTIEVRNSEWYLGEAFWETAKRNGIKTASHFWPGSDINLEYRRPDIFVKYLHNMPYLERIERAISWLKLPYDERPRFITLYFDLPDTYGHKYGPNSPQVDSSMFYCDKIIGMFLHKIRQLDIKDSVDIIILSDHGMTDVSENKIINVSKILKDYKIKYLDEGPIMFVEPTNPNEIMNVYLTLKKNEKNYKVYLKNEVPEYYKFSSHPFIWNIILVADIGYSLLTDESIESMKKYFSKGNHGYDHNHLDMHGIFLAIGPSFKKNYKTGSLYNIDIYPLLCKLFNISPRSNIDGKLERIEFILK